MLPKWKQHLLPLREGDCTTRDLLESIVILKDEEYSDFFKFLTAAVRAKPKVLDIVIERIQQEWLRYSANPHLFKSTVSFLGRLKKSVRREEMSEIVKLWPLIFDFPKENRLKLLLVKEYRRDLPFHWLLDFVLRDGFFYDENLNLDELDCGGVAVIEILVEILEKARSSGDTSDLCDELRVSGLLEKIGSLWRCPSRHKLLKLLALASSISNNTIFDSLPALLHELSSEDNSLWRLRLVDSILKRYPKKQYVLSQIRAELIGISEYVIKISADSLDSLDGDMEVIKSACSLLKSVLERWEALACTIEVELMFFESVKRFLDKTYKDVRDEGGFRVLYVFSREFVESMRYLLLIFFRNSVKYAAVCVRGVDVGVNVDDVDEATSYSTDTDILRWVALNSFTRLMVFDGGTDLGLLRLFREYPSLISDIHALIQFIGNEDDPVRWEWILLLAESPRTKNVLIDFLIDPKQVNELECDAFWLAFMGNLVTEDNFEVVDRWLGGKLVDQYFQRAKRFGREDQMQMNNVHLLKIVLTRDGDINCNLGFIFKCCRGNPEMFNWILLNKISDPEIIYNHLTELVPLGNASISRKVHELVKDRIRKADELIDCLLQPIPDRLALAEWNLLIESGKIKYKNDDEIDNNTAKDYGNYLERLFEVVVSPDESTVLVKGSDDPIEMYLEYYKYGQIRSLTLLQADLLNTYAKVELLLRIPLTILRATGLGPVLDHLLVEGWAEDDLWVVEKYSRNAEDELNLLRLRMYYKNRIE